MQGKYLPKREAKDEKDCSKDALVKSLELYQEKCAAPLATAAVDSVIAGTKQASFAASQLVAVAEQCCS